MSVGNLDIVPVAAALDLARIALASVVTTSAERTVKLLQSPILGPSGRPGRRAGHRRGSLAEFGGAAQAIAAEARTLAHPVSFEVVSTSKAEGIEDRTTMAPLSARRLAEMADLAARVVSLELFVAAQASTCAPLHGLVRGPGERIAWYASSPASPRGGQTPPADLGAPCRTRLCAGRFATASDRADGPA